MSDIANNNTSISIQFNCMNNPAHDKTNNTSATSEDSDQPAHPRSLIRVLADRMCLLLPPGYQKRDEREPCHTGLMYRLISVFAGHAGLIVGFVVRWLNYTNRLH